MTDIKNQLEKCQLQKVELKELERITAQLNKKADLEQTAQSLQTLHGLN